MNSNFTTQLQWFHSAKVKATLKDKFLSAMTERSTWDKSNLELFPGRFPLLPQIPPRSLLSQ